jgi:hypothetical protein
MDSVKTAKIFLSIFFFFILVPSAFAYPDFIGYGYSSCATCHYNGLGGGALNDYGRALFATEITARDVFPKNMDEEDIAGMSGFLWKGQLPWWFRPGLKFRSLWFEQNPGSKASLDRYINMQDDINLNFFLDKKQNFAIITTTTYVENDPQRNRNYAFFEKEYYLRWRLNNNFWVYLGQMDIAYGIRHADHTAANRAPLGLDQFSQSQGVITHFTYPTWDIALNAFFGNGSVQESQKEKGFSATGEYQVFEKFKVGGSVLTEESQVDKRQLAALTTRMGLSKGSSVIAEAGLNNYTNKVTNADAQLGSYAWLETLINIRRGYNILTSIEHSKTNINKSSPEVMNWSIGAMIFPLPRMEFRFAAVNGKVFDQNSGQYDNWMLQTQFHLSY